MLHAEIIKKSHPAKPNWVGSSRRSHRKIFDEIWLTGEIRPSTTRCWTTSGHGGPSLNKVPEWHSYPFVRPLHGNSGPPCGHSTTGGPASKVAVPCHPEFSEGSGVVGPGSLRRGQPQIPRRSATRNDSFEAKPPRGTQATVICTRGDKLLAYEAIKAIPGMRRVCVSEVVQWTS